MSGLPQHGPHGAWTTAARYGDADVGEHGIAECIRRQGIDAEALQHIADQRALRIILQHRGIAPAELTHLAAFVLTPLEQDIHRELTACYLDGLYIGWRARGLAEGKDDGQKDS